MASKTNIRKIVQALNYFAVRESGEVMNKMKAYKLLWLADRYHIRQYGRAISNDRYYALPYGTIPSDTKDILDGKLPCDELNSCLEIIDGNTYKSKSEPNLKVFSKADLQTLDLILDKYNSKTQFELSDYSHEFPEWLRFKSNLDDESKKKAYKVITDDFFTNVNDWSGLFNDDDDLLSMTRELYHS